MLAEYIYNGKGQRAEKWIASENKCTIYHYDLNGLLIAESTSSGTVKAEYVYLNGSPLAKIENNSIYFYHNDHLGAPMMMTDSSGSTVWQGEYLPFGEEYSVSGTVTNNLRFPGQYYDSETGLHYNYYRDYNPAIGRYVEADPIGIKRGQNHLYGYVGNNPVNFVDPDGKMAVVSGIILGGYSIAAVLIFIDCMERCTGTELLPENPNSCPINPINKPEDCVEICVQYALLLGFGADPLGSTATTLGQSSSGK